MKIKQTFYMNSEGIHQTENGIIWRNRTKQRNKEHWEYNCIGNYIKIFLLFTFP